MEHYFVLGRNKVLIYAITCMDLGNSEIKPNKQKTNTI